MIHHVLYALSLALFVGAFSVGMLAPTIAAPGDAHTYYIAQTGTPTLGAGTSCADPDAVGTTEAPIQAAVTASVGDDIIHICAGIYTISAPITLGVPQSGLVIEGAGVGVAILDGQNTTTAGISNNDGHQILHAAGQAITVHDLSFLAGYGVSGGAIEATTATITGSSFVNNVAAGSGGAINTTTLTIDTSSFTTNSASGFGGAIYSTMSTVATTAFTDNSAVGSGGAIYATTTTVNHGTFTNNAADGIGGAIYATTATLNSSSFTDNAGAAPAYGLDLTVIGSGSVADNHSSPVCSTGTCTQSYTEATVLTAAPGSVAWSGPSAAVCSGPTCTLNLVVAAGTLVQYDTSFNEMVNFIITATFVDGAAPAAPAAVWTALPASPSVAVPISWTLTFSESVTGLTASDITNLGTASCDTPTVSGSGSSYGVTYYTCSSEGTVTPRLEAGSVVSSESVVGPVATVTSPAITVDSGTATPSPSTSAEASAEASGAASAIPSGSGSPAPSTTPGATPPPDVGPPSTNRGASTVAQLLLIFAGFAGALAIATHRSHLAALPARHKPVRRTPARRATPSRKRR